MAGLGTNIGTSFSLRARMNGQAVIAGTSVPVWYFATGSGPDQGFMGDRQIPSVHIEPIEGQAIQLEFLKQSPMEHTIHLHGMDVDQANDGVPATSFAVPPQGSYTYQFIAPHAGTYHYHCHVDTVVHYALGMYGTVIVRPPDGSTTRAWDGGPTFDEEVLWHLSTVDTKWNQNLSVSGPGSARFYPNGFLLNGKETPDALVDPFTKVVIAQGQKAYIRVVQAAYEFARVSLAGLPFEVVASDGRPLANPVTATTWELAPGERYDLLFTGSTTGTYQARIEYLDIVTDAVLGSAETTVQVI